MTTTASGSATSGPASWRVATLGVASIYALVSAANVIGESWTYFFTLGAADHRLRDEG